MEFSMASHNQNDEIFFGVFQGILEIAPVVLGLPDAPLRR
jgi:hypothetical protein